MRLGLLERNLLDLAVPHREQVKTFHEAARLVGNFSRDAGKTLQPREAIAKLGAARELAGGEDGLEDIGGVVGQGFHRPGFRIENTLIIFDEFSDTGFFDPAKNPSTKTEPSENCDVRARSSGLFHVLIPRKRTFSTSR